MPVDRTATATDELSAEVLRRYRTRLRPWRIAYAAAIVVVVAAALAIVKIAYVRGEISHAHLHTVASGPAAVTLRQPSTTQTERWSTSEDAAIGTPYFDGTVVTYSAHAVRGRDALAGTPTWSYTRTDRTVCTAAQDDGITVTIWRIRGDCGELTAVDTDTGRRLWDRTLDENGYPVDGTPPVSIFRGQVMVTTHRAIYMITTAGDNVRGAQGGNDLWMFDQQGCTINSAVMGSAGVLISQTCAHRRCSGVAHCGNGPQLLLRDLVTGYDNGSTPDANRDRIDWDDIGSTLVPVSAGQVVSAVPAGGGSLDVLSTGKGTTLHRLPVSGPAPSSTTPQDTVTAETDDAQLVHLGSTTYALRAGAARFAWHARVPLPTVSQPTGETVDDAPSLDHSVLAVPTGTGVAELDPATGRPRSVRTLAPAPTGRVFPFGAGFLAAGTSTAGYA